MYRAVGERGQVTIPKRIRERLNIGKGTRLVVREQRGEVVLRKVQEDDPIAAVYGMFGGGMTTDEFLDEIRGPADLPPVDGPT